MTALYEGKAKKILATEEEGVLIQYFKDSATAFNGEKYAEFEGKGRLNNRISSIFFQALKESGVPSHYIDWISDREMKVESVEIIPLEVVVRNRAAGSLSKRLGLPEGTDLPSPVVEMYYKRDDLGDPLLNTSHINTLGLAVESELEACKQGGLTVNRVLSEMLSEIGMTLIDFKLEYGRTADGRVLLADEISPDTCRLWDDKTARRMDKDVFRRDLADLVETYTEVYERLRKQFPQYDVAE